MELNQRELKALYISLRRCVVMWIVIVFLCLDREVS